MTSRIVCHPDPVVKPQIQCPYNPAHFLYEERFQRHLVTCRTSHPEIAAKMDTCKFNQTHVILKSKMFAHLQECPDRRIVVPSQSSNDTVRLSELSRPLGTVAASEEDWETEVNETSYDPSRRMAHLDMAPVPSGMKKADRKVFRNHTRIVLGNRSGNMPEGVDPDAHTPLPKPLPYAPTAGRGRGKPVNPPSMMTVQEDIRVSVKIMDVTEVPKPKASRIAAQFSAPSATGPVQPARTIGRGRLANEAFDQEFPALGGAGRGRPPPGFEGETLANRISGLSL